MKNIITVTVFVSLCLSGGCVSRTWNGHVQRWGTLRSVLRDGDTAGKVHLSEATTPHSFGIGAPEGLAGEIVVLEGEAWVAQADAHGRAETHHPPPPDATATFLAMAIVPRWVDMPADDTLSLDDLEQAIRTAGKRNGLNMKAPFPFLVEGRFSAVKLHILNGRCPFAQPQPKDDPTHDPVRVQAESVQGVLVGFYYDGPPGVLTHAGKRLHVHAILKDGQHSIGHVESISVEAGAVIRVPAIH